MKKKLLTFLFLTCLASVTNAQIQNPVWGPDWPDPTVWMGDDGNYYSVATGLRHLIKSSDLAHWEAVHQPLLDRETRHQMHQYGRHFWAPDVTTVAGQRLLYITLYNSKEDSNIGVLKEDRPGHFVFHGIITRGKETGIDDTIDPEVITDPETGIVWLYFGSVGGIHRVQLAEDGLSVAPDSKYEHVAGLTVEQNHSRSRVYEGAYLCQHEGYWYLFVSSGHYGNHTYQLQVGRSKTLDGVFVNKEGKNMVEGYASPVLTSEKGDRFYGPGHCGEVFEREGRTFLFYHCHDSELPHQNQRPMFLQEILWDNEGWPYFEGGKPL